MKSCCEHNGFEEGGCNGRNCPEGRVDLAAAWRYLRGYLPIFIQFRDHAAAKRAGHLAAITPSEPIDWQLVVIYSAVAVALVACALLSIH